MKLNRAILIIFLGVSSCRDKCVKSKEADDVMGRLSRIEDLQTRQMGKLYNDVFIPGSRSPSSAIAGLSDVLAENILMPSVVMYHDGICYVLNSEGVIIDIRLVETNHFGQRKYDFDDYIREKSKDRPESR